jgi:hypothetical protein
VAAAWGGLVGAMIVYMLVAGIGGGVDLEDRLTFDQSGELELEGIFIGVGLVVGPVLGLPIGVYALLRRRRAPRAGTTALAALLPAWAATWAAVNLFSSGNEDPVVAPYFVFGSWFVVPLLTRLVFERPNDGPPERIDPQF